MLILLNMFKSSPYLILGGLLLILLFGKALNKLTTFIIQLIVIYILVNIIASYFGYTLPNPLELFALFSKFLSHLIPKLTDRLVEISSQIFTN